MFDADTAALIRQAPDLPDQSAADLPILLTGIYAELVSSRLRNKPLSDAEISVLIEIADAYELITVVSNDVEVRRPSAFVAATAQQIYSKIGGIDKSDWTSLTRDWVSPAITAPLLFLISEQYPDANEAANALPRRGEADDFRYETLLVEAVRDLAKGAFKNILAAAARRVRYGRVGRRTPTSELYHRLLDGVELLASELLSEEHPSPRSLGANTSADAFQIVIDLASAEFAFPLGEAPLRVGQPGPAHLASILKVAGETMGQASVMKVPPSAGGDVNMWTRWLTHRASTKPLLWANHRTVLSTGFHHPGNSALLTLPTGAGKTTVAEFKIAATLAQGKSVIFLVPTHALQDQLVDDLGDAFPEDIIGTPIGSDFDLLTFMSGPPRIEVMTPEMCLSRLGMDTTSFSNAGLMVFDECHLLSASSGSLQRALDAMLAVLGFQARVPDADFLFLSAMVRDSADFGSWISVITGRSFIVSDPTWKPSRQARGVLCYDRTELNAAVQSATLAQQAKERKLKRKLKKVGQDGIAQLRALPLALFGLQHNWNSQAPTQRALVPLLDTTVPLGGNLDDDGSIYPISNANEVSAMIAAQAASQGLKTIVFVPNAQQTFKNAERIAATLPPPAEKTDFEQRLWDAITEEIGDDAVSMVPGWVAALPHSAQLLPIERKFVETLYRRAAGASVIVATTTLSQGMNLPSEFAIISGDKRASLSGREELKAHEVLNAAGRAGRAGHLANGIVLLVPEGVMRVVNGAPAAATRAKLASILPESDRCVDLDDPITTVLDSIQEGAQTPEALYFVSRISGAVDGVTRLDDLRNRSLAAFQAKRKNVEASFTRKLTRLKVEIDEWEAAGLAPELMEIASQRGHSPSLINRIYSRLQRTADLPDDVPGWISWATDMFKKYPTTVELLGTSRDSVFDALKKKRGVPLQPSDWATIEAALLKWVCGEPLQEIEESLGFFVDDVCCKQAREIAIDLAPKGFSFAMGLIAQLAKLVATERDLAYPLLDYLPSLIRRGFDSTELLDFANVTKGPLTRVQYHKAYRRKLALGL